MHQQSIHAPSGAVTVQNGTRVGKARGIKHAVLLAVLSASLSAGMANAGIEIPPELIQVFKDLAIAFGALMAAGAVLFGVIRGGVALFKLAGRIFSAAGA
ncbi:hypothetical protein [Metapseudomonas furukawaii]|uniref:Uncharacterized protein n=1 Tax=Metapseudomonas furukawaii TaxID=1149133 RepID=A0AAD1FHM1_METFU|nr:hypothetical protein [Pseudomonas furukawaii]ELS29326.1 hypothetical protein ppKF707_0151 [Pseudomonas furukawaii]BAU76514.1 hypothetical protein KF707C_48260 [Pseudomonas furukawaii]